LQSSIGANIRIEAALAADLWPALADSGQIELVLLNLAINARDAMPDGGVITISSALERELVGDGRGSERSFGVISVTDTGTGIPPELIEKVFDPFFTTKPVGKGTGLGLSQVYGIARQSGGTVKLRSAIGEGTTVSIWLPVTARPRQSDGESDSNEESERPETGERILVVEDDDGVRRFLVECREMLGCEVFQAANGLEALDRLATARPHLMIVDFAMPGMNGAELATRVRQRLPDLPIILATGYADMDAVDEVVAADRVLRKPFHIDELAAAVRAALTDRHALVAAS